MLIDKKFIDPNDVSKPWRKNKLEKVDWCWDSYQKIIFLQSKNVANGRHTLNIIKEKTAKYNARSHIRRVFTKK